VLQCLQLAKIAIGQCKHGCERKKKNKEKRKDKDDRMLIRSDLIYFNLIFCGPERIEEKMAITRDLDTSIHPRPCKVYK
jgi:hypothetical protein